MQESDYAWQMCGKKQDYRKLKSAQNFIRLASKRGIMISSNYKPYKCPYCSYWHIGHDKYEKTK